MKLLQLLADGQFHSGAALGEALGISRAAVWKQISAWRERGLAFDVVQGKGYRLQYAFELWDESLITKELDADAKTALKKLVLKEQTGSTNDDVMSLLREYKQSGIVCIAEEQTTGRGRRGRSWVSTLGTSFLGSIGWQFSSGISAIEGLSLAVGVAVVRALENYGVPNIQLKWPNDLLVGDAKLGGVLIDLQAETDGPCWVVVGLGLNLVSIPSLAQTLDRPVTALDQYSKGVIQRNRLGALILQELLALLSSYEEQGFKAYQSAWNLLDAYKGLPVKITGIEPEIEGIESGVNEQGALCIKTEKTVQIIYGGEVSLKSVGF